MHQSTDLTALRDEWAAHWPDALAVWSKFTKLREPRWCCTTGEERAESLTGSFAMIRLADHAVVISLRQVRDKKLEAFAVEIMAHEIGHHVYCPADLSDHARTIARIRAALPSKEHLAPLVANLYTDLLINDRLQRSAGLKMAEVYKALERGSGDRLWTLYMRIYETLWSLPKGTLAAGEIDATLDGDAYLGSRVVRSYAKDWMRGAGRFAALCLPYLLESEGEDVAHLLKGWHDTGQAGQGGLPDGLTEIDPEELAGAIHPALDEELSGVADDQADSEGLAPAASEQPGGTPGQRREPFAYGEILKSLGIKLSDHDIAVRYYREQAAPHLVRFPVREMPESQEPLLEGLAEWDIGQPLEDLDWLESAIASPHIIPGLTTVQRTYGTSTGALPEREPVDLDLYVDCSGSMPNPQVNISYLTLAGAIITLSALRAGARVKATLWSGKQDFQTTGEFVRDEAAVLRILTGYIGGATQFPIHLLRQTFEHRRPDARRVHVLVISDDGVTTMFDNDERGHSGWDTARLALSRGGAGGTLVLNLYWPIEQLPALVQAQQEGWAVFRVQTWEDLVAFARQFSRANYERRDAAVR